jgi:DNA-binding NarL/FixJ family response regulator
VSDAEAELLADGAAALAAGRWGDAATAFETALARREEPDRRFRLGIAVFWMGETTAALRHWERAYVGFRRIGEFEQAVMAAVYLSLAYRMSLGNDAASRGWIQRAARLVADHRLEPMEGWVLVCRAHRAIDIGQPKAAEAWSRHAIDLARAAADLDLELCALSELGAALVDQGRTEEGAAFLDEAMAGALAGEGLDPDSVVLVSCRTITACSRGGDLPRAAQWVRAADDYYRRFGSPHLYTTCRVQFGRILVAAGRWREAEAELRAAVRIGEGAEPALYAEALATLAEMRVAEGRLEEAARLLHGYEDVPGAASAVALVQLARGDAGAAIATLRRRLRQVDLASLDAAILLELLVMAELAAGPSRSPMRRARSIGRRGLTGNLPAVRARGDRAVGRVLLARSQAREATQHLERAVSGFIAAGMPIEVARSRVLLARALAQVHAQSAIAEAQRALSAFEAVDASREADEASSLLRALGARPTRHGVRSSGVLTKREHEVLALLGEGLSNPEIGRRLFITRKTVEHHVASVLAKIGLSGRGEAAAYAVRMLDRGHAENR